MDSVRRGFDNVITRAILGHNNFIILSSSAIITGILSYFIHRYHARGTHLIYQEVIVSTLTKIY